VSAGFRELAKRHHPDLNGGDGETMKELNAAVEMLREMLRRENQVFPPK
jgi:curved DNA-binding protein CbpA